MNKTGVFKNFLDQVFGIKSENKKEVIPLNELIISGEFQTLRMDTYALFTAVEMLANLLADCEIKVYNEGREEHNRLWQKLNYRPNVNQTATAFWREFYSKLLYEGQVMSFETFDAEQWIIADGFTLSDYVIREKYFSDVYRGTFQSRVSFPMSEVIYISYPNENAEALKTGLLSKYDKLILSATESYDLGTGNKVFLNINQVAQADVKFEERYKELMNNRFKSFFKNKNAVMPLFNGYSATFANSSTSGTATVKDILELSKDSLVKAAQAYKIAPALLTGDVAGLKDAVDFTLTSALDPLANASSEVLSTSFYGADEIIRGSKCVVDTSNIKHVDIFDISTSVEKLISSGFMNIDELRPFAGLNPTGRPEHQQYYLSKNYSTIDEIMRTGGETE